MKERLRAPLAAAVAFLIGGGLAARGPGWLLDPWGFAFPYLWLFLAFEAARRRRRLLDAEAFILGAAAGLVFDGMYAKTLQDGVLFLGIDWLSSVATAFDWGMVTVVALHVADALLPRPGEEPPPSEASGGLELGALVFIPAAALTMYLFDGWVGRTRFERMLGPTWMLADLLFAAAAVALLRRAAVRSRADEPGERDRWLWALAIFCGWLPGAQLFARAGEWPSLLSALYVAAWTAGFGAWTWRLWRERGRAAWEPRRAVRPILALAAWRLLGAVLLALFLGPMEINDRTAPAFGFLVDLPTRLIFLSLFFSSRLAV
ncbi:MAG TPA: hypothetical protein VH309_10320 [Elusimicrobiota bacterium]|nr:hypothetical protein [Elusimicrobiota bacterium]